MTGRVKVSVASLLVLCAVSTATSQADAVHTSRSRFRIPFSFDQARYERLGAQQIQLFLSRDQGQNWRHVQSAAPSAQRFEFDAVEEGEYWFAVRTQDAQNRLHPSGELTAGLKVIVDRSAPRLLLATHSHSAGGLVVAWDATDAHLDTETLVIEYQQPGADNWQRINIAPNASGEVTIPGSGGVTVRARISDRAGNEATAESEDKPTVTPSAPKQTPPEKRLLPPLPAADSSRNGTPSQDAMPSVRSGPSSPSRSSAGPIEYEALRRAIAARRRERAQAATPTVLKPEAPSPLPPSPVPAPGVTGGPAPTTPAPQLQVTQPVAPQSNVARSNVTQSNVTQPRGSNVLLSRPISSNPPAAMAPTASPFPPKSATPENPYGMVQPLSPAARNGGLSANPGQTSNVPSQNVSLQRPVPLNTAPIVQPRLVNQQVFQIGYLVENLGPSGVSGVEVYITEDNGQKWWRYGDDRDLRSPAVIQVPREGVYGFTIRVRSGVGLGVATPKPGDAPQVVVVVDQTAPVVTLQSINLSPQDNNTVQIAWETSDPNPADRPVAVQWGQGPNGPWHSISDWQEDHGGVEWRLGHSIPSQVYIRLLARDAAGNVNMVTTPEAVVLDLARPTTRIVEIGIPQLR